MSLESLNVVVPLSAMAAISLLRALLEVQPDDDNVHRKAFTLVARCLVECCHCHPEKSEVELSDEAWFSRLVPQVDGGAVRYRQRVVAYQNWKRPWTSGHSRALAAQSIADHGSRAPNITVVIVDAAVTKTAMNLGAEPRRCRWKSLFASVAFRRDRSNEKAPPCPRRLRAFGRVFHR